jgi:hypothetical protein
VLDPDSTSDPRATLSDALLLTFALSNVDLTFGTSGFGLSIDSGTLGVTTVAPADALDTRRWIAVTAADLAITLNLGRLVSATVENGVVKVSRRAGRRHYLNWKTDLDVHGDGTFGDTG